MLTVSGLLMKICFLMGMAMAEKVFAIARRATAHLFMLRHASELA